MSDEAFATRALGVAPSRGSRARSRGERGRGPGKAPRPGGVKVARQPGGVQKIARNNLKGKLQGKIQGNRKGNGAAMQRAPLPKPQQAPKQAGRHTLLLMQEKSAASSKVAPRARSARRRVHNCSCMHCTHPYI